MAQPIPLPVISPTSAVETVDADTARAWLSRNTHNRNISRAAVAAYARDMREGRWMFTGEAIKFAKDGTLLDGQHRLMAIAEAGDIAIPLLVIRGLDPRSQDAMDTGRRRTAADALALHGEKASTLLAAAARMVLTDGGRTSRNVTTGEITALLNSDPSLHILCTEVVPHLRLTVVTPVVAAYSYWRLDKISADAAAEFFGQLASLTGLPAGSPILALHRRLIAYNRTNGTRSRGYRNEALAYIFTAWNAWARGEQRALIKLSYADGRISIPDPVAPRFRPDTTPTREI